MKKNNVEKVDPQKVETKQWVKVGPQKVEKKQWVKVGPPKVEKTMVKSGPPKS